MKKKKVNGDGKMPTGMIFLVIFLIWIALKTIGNLIIGQGSLDANLLAHYGLLYISQIIFVPLFILNLLSIYAIFSRRKFGYKILLSFFILSILLIIGMYFLSIYDLDLLRELAIQSRTDRGLSVEAVEFAINPLILGTVSLFFSIFYVLLIYYVHKKKYYFSK